MKGKSGIKILLLLGVFFAFPYTLHPSPSTQETHPVLVLRIKGAVDPAMARYVRRGIEEARRAQASALVLELDTPGGLDSSMRKITREILDSPVPVIAYVFPSSAGGAAAIAESAHVAAKAPEVKDLDDLLNQAEGRQVKTIFGMTTLSFQGRPRQAFPLSLMESILHRMAHPNLAYILLLLGIYGLVYELATPGAVFPGIFGTIFLALALVVLETLEVNWGGIALIGLALFLFRAAVKRSGSKALTVGGILSFVLGSAFLFPGIRIASLKLPWSTIGAATLLTAALFFGIVRAGLRARRQRV